MTLTGHTANLPSDVLLDMGILMIGSTVIGVTRGAPQFSPNIEVDSLEFDGRHAPIKGGDRFFYGPAKFTATLIEFGDSSTGNQIAKLLPGSTSASAGSPNVTTITPKVGGGFVASGDYNSDVRLIFERGIGSGTKKYAAVLFPCALVEQWDSLQGETKKGASYQITIGARKDMASGTTADAPFKIELREALP